MSKRLPTPETIELASNRRMAFMEAIPVGLASDEDSLPRTVTEMNASRRSKLQRIYLLTDKLAEVREPYVACKRGCASCCRMNVTITNAEAEKLGSAIGRKPASVDTTLRRPSDYFAGRPCTFLGADEACSIYPHRPLSCRKHASFFEDAGPCHPEVMNEVKVPLVGFSGLDDALFSVPGTDGALILADIRDFFPATS
jgi:uncharacterized protein